MGWLILSGWLFLHPVWAQSQGASPLSPVLSSRPTALVFGGIPVFELQGGDYPSEARVGNVSFVIEQFLRPQDGNTIPIPEVRVLQDDNRQFTLVLGEEQAFEATQRYLFTVTYADAATANGIAVEEATLSQVQQVANRWAIDLQRALRDYRQDLLAADWGNQPFTVFLSVVIALSLVVSVVPMWRGAKN